MTRDYDAASRLILLTQELTGSTKDLTLRGMHPQVFARTIEVPFMGVNLRIVGREDFIAMKCFAGGTQDILDAR